MSTDHIDNNEPPVKKQKTEQPPQNNENKDTGIVESDVGITEYLSPDIAGFQGILKQRYTDFLVNEINSGNQVLHLTDLGLPEITKEEPKIDAQENNKKEKPELSDEQRKQLAQFVGEEIVDKMLELFNTGNKIETEQSFNDKDERTKLHQLIREIFNSRLETRTTDDNRFVILLNSKSSRKNRKFDKSLVGDAKPFVRFLIYKENKETMDVANLISKLLRIPPKSVGFMGTKDRRGVTVQEASIHKIKMERLNGLNKSLKGVKLGSFKYNDEPCKLGGLNGNEFYITLRDVDNTDHLTELFESLKTKGFINYYGMQRFGTFSISTHTVGKYVLNGNYDKVVDLILSPQELVLPDSVEARRIYSETKDAAKALDKMPRKCVAEHAILRSLSKDPSSSINAVMQIPRNLRVMYAHAYQSYIWNNAASERIRKYGLKVVPGDLVIDTETKVSKFDSDNNIEEDVKYSDFVRARVVTEEDIKIMTIFDIVLPTPGFDILYPENEIENVYKDMMAKDGIDYKKMERNIKEFSLSGSYRAVVARPENVEFWVRKYNQPADQIVRTDLDLLQGELGEESRLVQPPTEEEGEKTAVVLKMQLGSSTYATMALREVMKVDTSRSASGLNVSKTVNGN